MSTPSGAAHRACDARIPEVPRCEAPFGCAAAAVWGTTHRRGSDVHLFRRFASFWAERALCRPPNVVQSRRSCGAMRGIACVSIAQWLHVSALLIPRSFWSRAWDGHLAVMLNCSKHFVAPGAPALQSRELRGQPSLVRGKDLFPRQSSCYLHSSGNYFVSRRASALKSCGASPHS